MLLSFAFVHVHQFLLRTLVCHAPLRHYLIFQLTCYLPRASFLSHFYFQHHPNTHIHIIGNSKKALQVLNELSIDKMTPKHKNTNVISGILSLCDQLPITISTEHVYSHQNQNTPKTLLPKAI